MGQQQLLLLVLGVIIVGIAVVAGIGMFNAAAEESVKDECSAQLMAIGANAQQWYKKPLSMGGGGGSFLNYEIPIGMIATESAGTPAVYSATGTVTTQAIAGYTITTAGGATGVTITADPNEAAYAWTASIAVSSQGMTVSFSDN